MDLLTTHISNLKLMVAERKVEAYRTWLTHPHGRDVLTARQVITEIHSPNSVRYERQFEPLNGHRCIRVHATCRQQNKQFPTFFFV